MYEQPSRMAAHAKIVDGETWAIRCTRVNRRAIDNVGLRVFKENTRNSRNPKKWYLNV